MFAGHYLNQTDIWVAERQHEPNAVVIYFICQFVKFSSDHALEFTGQRQPHVSNECAPKMGKREEKICFSVRWSIWIEWRALKWKHRKAEIIFIGPTLTDCFCWNSVLQYSVQWSVNILIFVQNATISFPFSIKSALAIFISEKKGTRIG